MTYWNDLSPEERFDMQHEKVTESGCWIWTSHTHDDYGRIRVNGKNLKAHRYSYQRFVGDPSGMLVCHKCDVPSCVNPDHLFLGTDRDNSDDKIKKGRLPSVAGRNNPKSKLTPEQVAEIRLLRGKMSQDKMAEKYGIGQTTVSRVMRGDHWSLRENG